jgi:hypothetical protein
MRSEWDGEVKRMVNLFNQPFNPHCNITVHLNETLSKDKTNMRLVFNTTLTVDVAAHDDELRAAFIELVSQSARAVYGPAAMLAKSKPILTITVTDREGMADIDLFAETNPEGN